MKILNHCIGLAMWLAAAVLVAQAAEAAPVRTYPVKLWTITCGCPLKNTRLFCTAVFSNGLAVSIWDHGKPVENYDACDREAIRMEGAATLHQYAARYAQAHPAQRSRRVLERTQCQCSSEGIFNTQIECNGEFRNELSQATLLKFFTTGMGDSNHTDCDAVKDRFERRINGIAVGIK